MNKLFFTVITVILLTSCKSKQNTVSTSTTNTGKAVSTYWQQHVDYTMNIDMDAKNYQFNGTQKLVYTNNSPDDLRVVFYHLYFNAFQPNSEMDARVQTIADPDGRMAPNIGTKEKPIFESRIAKLKPSEIGFQKIKSLKQNGKPVKYEIIGTILKVTLNETIKSGSKTTFDMVFKAQVPVQIRRSGRNNKEGVALSMAQWYPKMAEYDFEGWHADAYIAREFHGVWGDFDVTINIDKDYVLGGTGYLQNPQEIGHGYERKGYSLTNQNVDKFAWHFKAPNVHDFTWAADKDFIHDIKKVDDNTVIHFLYKNSLSDTYKNTWAKMQNDAVNTMKFYNKIMGDYPYKQYSIIQGGDGGMEYGMCTLVTGKRTLKSLIGVVRHEMAHSWHQFVLATNESKHPWMDEGFTSYINVLADQELDGKKEFPYERTYQTYNYLVNSGKNEPLTTHGDRYHTNMAYGINSYYKGLMFLSQLEYIIGKENVLKTLKKYYSDFKFKHPNPNDITRTAEKISGVQLHWYLDEWTKTLHNIDYSIKSVSNMEITLERLGKMPMPIDVKVEFNDGSTEDFYIPLRMMLGSKETNATKLKDWAWSYPTYKFSVKKQVKKVSLAPSKLMADVDLKNNVFIVE
ncbi:MAG TPA: M1 family peptidase [Flavobacteriaceae bacterium]|nr:M1 family peptidase [Flavobacteriaceae bacterium]HIP26953.1 M1 family peptidase [Flavobacteriaceae bacterium]